MARTQYRAWCESCARERECNADHNRLAAEQDQVIDDVPVDYAFLGEHDQTAKLVLTLREHRCRWTEALQGVRVLQSVADVVRLTRLAKFQGIDSVSDF